MGSKDSDQTRSPVSLGHAQTLTIVLKENGKARGPHLDGWQKVIPPTRSPLLLEKSDDMTMEAFLPRSACVSVQCVWSG